MNEFEEEVEDFLEVDQPIPGQNFVCLSFLSPEKEIHQKEAYYNYNFYKNQMNLLHKIVDHQISEAVACADSDGKVDKVHLEEISHQLNEIFDRMDLGNAYNRYLFLKTEKLRKRLDEERKEFIEQGLESKLAAIKEADAEKEITKEVEAKCRSELESEFNLNNPLSLPQEENDLKVSFQEFEEKFQDEYGNFMVTHEDKMQNEFNEHVDFRTNIRGVKVRGTFESEREARMRAKILRKKDPSFHVWVGQVGYWLPVDADPDKAASSEYAEKELQELSKKKKENELKTEQMYNLRREEEKREAALKNKRIKEQQKMEREKRVQEVEEQYQESINKQKETVTESLDSNTIEELLKTKREETAKPSPIKQQIEDAGFDKMDPWLARKIADKAAADMDNDDGVNDGDNVDDEFDI